MSGDKALSERLVKTNTAGNTIEDGCCKGNNERGAGGIVDPGTIAARLDAIRASMAAIPHDPDPEHFGMHPAILHVDARTLTEMYAPVIGTRGRVYLDPPYQGATGYPAVCPRDEVLWIAEEWARHGACVVLSEAVGLAGELGSGWVEEQLPSAKKPEWITVYRGAS